MGAIQENNAIFLSIADGKISRRVKSKTEKSIQRTTKEGKVVHEEFYRGWKGRITNIQVRKHAEYGKFWNITLSDEEGDAVLQMNYSSGYASAFLKILPNVDFSQDVLITPNLKIEGDKKKTSLFISQDGLALKHYYTRDNPNGLPPLQQVKVKGKMTWDDSDMMEFLENMVRTEILPKIKQQGNVAKAEPATVGIDEVEIIEDNLPF
jgi:hypothetical protein